MTRAARRPLIILVSHGLDLMTFMLVIGWLGIHVDIESNALMRDLYLAGGFGLVVVLKAAGASALALFSAWDRYPWFSRVAFVPSAGMGLVGALVNSVALTRL